VPFQLLFLIAAVRDNEETLREQAIQHLTPQYDADGKLVPTKKEFQKIVRNQLFCIIL
jgi:hypothetical protein